MILPAELFAVQKSCLCSPLAWVHITVTKKSMLGKAWCLKCKERRNLSKADLPNGSSAFCWMSQGPWPQGSCAPSVPSEGTESKAQHGHFAFHTWVSQSGAAPSPLGEGQNTVISLWNRFLCFWQRCIHISFLWERTKTVSLQGFNFRSFQSPDLLRLLLWATN